MRCSMAFLYSQCRPWLLRLHTAKLHVRGAVEVECSRQTTTRSYGDRLNLRKLRVFNDAGRCTMPAGFLCVACFTLHKRDDKDSLIQ